MRKATFYLWKLEYLKGEKLINFIMKEKHMGDIYEKSYFLPMEIRVS